MSFVERTSYMLTLRMLKFFDPNRRGWCIDAGAGNDNFWFEWLFMDGYKTIVVEPFPTKPVMERCEKYGIRPLAVALSDKNGVQDIWTDGKELHSLTPERWVSPMFRKNEVGTMTVSKVCELALPQASRLVMIKLDIEGAECAVIEDMLGASEETGLAISPSIIVFEFGGQTHRHTQKGPWSKENVAKLAGTLDILQVAGYSHGFVVHEGGSPLTFPFDRAIDALGLTGPDTAWGNIVIMRSVDKGNLLSWMSPFWE